MTRSMVAELTQRLFAGDVGALVGHLLTEQEIDAQELERLRELIARRERESMASISCSWLEKAWTTPSSS